MDANASPPNGVSVDPNCDKCRSGGMELLIVLPRLGDRPTFHIFRCIACGLIDWIAEADGQPKRR